MKNWDFGRKLSHARVRAGFSQRQLANATGFHQSEISLLEQGKRMPSAPQPLELARALTVSLHYFLTGSNYPQQGSGLADLAFQLQELGIADLHVENARVPGAFIHDEEAVALALAGNAPPARIVDAIPAVLAWNAKNPDLLRTFADLQIVIDYLQGRSVNL